MRLVATLALAAALSLGVDVGVGAQGTPAGGAALAVPVSGEIVVRNQGPLQPQGQPIFGVSPGATQQFDVDLALPVLGMPLRGPASIIMERHLAPGFFAPTQSVSGQANNVVLHGPAGVAIVSLALADGFWARDPSAEPLRVRGADGTGMFEGIRVSGDLKGIFKPQGTLYLGYASSDAALAAIQRGLAQNGALSDAQRAEALEQAKQAVVQAQLTTFPAEAALGAASQPQPATPQTPPAQADVTATIQRAGTQAQVRLQIVVPAGGPHQAVKVVATGPDGSARTVYDGVQDPGARVSASASGTAPFVVLVYVAGAMVKQITVDAQ